MARHGCGPSLCGGPSSPAALHKVAHLLLLFGVQAVVEVGHGGEHRAAGLHGAQFLVQQGLGAGAVELSPATRACTWRAGSPAWPTTAARWACNLSASVASFVLRIVQVELAAHRSITCRAPRPCVGVHGAVAVVVPARATVRPPTRMEGAEQAEKGFLDPGLHGAGPFKGTALNMAHGATPVRWRHLCAVSVYFGLFQPGVSPQRDCR